MESGCRLHELAWVVTVRSLGRQNATSGPVCRARQENSSRWLLICFSLYPRRRVEAGASEPRLESPNLQITCRFPTCLRTAHPRKIAVQLSKARTNREADHVLLRAIDGKCDKVNASWRPIVEPASDNSGGAA